MNSKTLQRIISASLLSGALLFTAVAQAAVVNRVPLLGYASRTISIYRSPGGASAGIALAAGKSLIQLTQIRADGWAYGTFPLSNGRRAGGWFKMSDIQPNITYSNWNGKPLYDNYKVDRTPDSAAMAGNGVISKSDAVLVVGEQGSMLQIIYKQKNSVNWRIGWVASSVIQRAQAATTNNTAQNNTVNRSQTVATTTKTTSAPAQKASSNTKTTAATTPTGIAAKSTASATSNTTTAQNNQTTNTVKTTQQTNTTTKSGTGQLVLVDNPAANRSLGGKPMKGDVNGDGQITLTDFSKINVHCSGGEKIDLVYLKNADVNEDGLIDEDDAAIVRNVYMGLDSMSNYPSNYSRWTKTATKSVNAYDTPALKKQRNANERVDKGDRITVYAETGNAYYVSYPISNGFKKRWVSKDVFAEEQNVIKIVYPVNGYYSIQPMCAPGKELTVQGGGTAQGTNVCISTIGSDRQTTPSHQKWYLERIGNSDWYKILAENSKLALNVHNGAAADWTNVSIWPYSGNMHEFRFYDVGGGYYLIQGHIDGSKAYVLDVYYGGSADGTNVQSHSYNNTVSQKWKLVKRDAATVQRTPAYKQFTSTAKRTVNAFNDSSLSPSSWDGKSRVDYNDTITIEREQGNAYFVRYPIRTAPYYKEKWVTKEVLKEIPQGERVQDALNWCEQQINKTIGSGQCVAFVNAYYNYQGTNAVTGDGKDFAVNVPSGWKSIQNGVPQPGDVLVYKGAKYGHVAIYAGNNTVYQQNYNNPLHVEKTTNWSYNRSWYSKNEGGTKYYWGCVRPVF